MANSTVTKYCPRCDRAFVGKDDKSVMEAIFLHVSCAHLDYQLDRDDWFEAKSNN